MKVYIFMALFVSAFAFAGHEETCAEQRIAVQKLRTFCAACHALGELRFIHSDSDDEVWQYLFNNDAPNAKKRWARAIIEVLDWPNDSAPPFNEMIVAPDKDWMPKGKKRLTFAQDRVENEPTRRFLLRSLNESMSFPPQFCEPGVFR